MSSFDTSSSSSDSNDEESGFEPLKVDFLDLTEFGVVEAENGRRLALSSLPGAKFRDIYRQNLNRDVDSIVASGITDVVCLLTENEPKKYKVGGLFRVYREKGLKVHRVPIIDGLPPTFEQVEAVREIVSEVLGDPRRKALIHCFGGLGRTCTLTGCILLSLKKETPFEGLVEFLRSVRGQNAIQSVKQYNFLQDFKHRLLALDQEESDLAR